MFRDEQRCNVWDQIRQRDLRVFGKILTPALMIEAAQATGVKLGNNALNYANLVWLGIAAALTFVAIIGKQICGLGKQTRQ